MTRSARALIICVQMSMVMVAAAFDTAFAQDNVTTIATDTLNTAGESKLGFGNGSLIFAPIPLKNPALGGGLIVTGAYLFEFDKKSGTSFIGLAAMGTTNGSRGVGAATNLSFGEGRWNIQAAYGDAAANYSLYSVGGVNVGPLPISQDGIFGKFKINYGLTDHLSAGIDTLYLETTIRLNGGPGFLFPNFPGFGISVPEAIFGPNITWDTRDDDVYPTDGLYGSLTVQKGVVLNGLRNEFWKSVALGKYFRPISDRDVFAMSFTGCRATNDAPFFNLCGVGTTDGLRGFTAGQFLDERLLSTQAEFRHRFSDSWGGVVFGGAAVVGQSSGSIGGTGAIYAGGVGLRYRLSRKFPLDFSVDATLNNSGNKYAYIYVGQSF